MSLSLSFSPFLLAACLLVAAGLTYWMYRRTVPALSPVRRALLMGLRFLTLFLVLFLLFQPVWRQVSRQAEPPVLAVLVDDSQSLGMPGAAGDTAAADPGEAVREALQQLPLGALDGEAQFFRFSGDAEAVDGEAMVAPDSARFRGERTNIARALDRVREELGDRNLGGVLLVSDGQYNTGRNPLYVAERYPVPIHALVVGDTTRHRDLQIRRVTTNEIAYVGTELPVQVSLRAEGFAEEDVTVTLLQNGRRLDAASVRLPEGAAEVTTDLRFTPEAEGLQQVQVAVTQLPGEVTHRNNTETVAVRVLESKKQILMLSAAPDPDLSAIRQLLRADPNLEVRSYVQKSRGEFYEGALPNALDDVDLLVLAGYPGQAADPATVARVATLAEQGTPVLFLLTHRTDLRLVREYLGEALPATPETVRPGVDEAAFVMTNRGARHAVLNIPDVEEAALRRLPPLLYNGSRWVASPDALVLATTEVRGIPLDDPLLALRSRAGYRSAVLLGVGTWRWRNLPTDLDALAPFWPGLLSNLVQWLTTPEDDRRVRVEPVEELFGGGERVEFTGQVYDESLNPVSDASVSVRITAPDSTQYPHQMEPAGNGRYALDVGSLPEGTYRYEATAEREDETLGTDRGSFAVGALTLEFKETQADAALMRQIAQRSNGAFFTTADAAELPARLAASSTFAPVEHMEETETALWRLYGFLAVIVALLAAEWFLRKRSGMV